MPQLTDRSKLPNIVDSVIREGMDLKHLYQVRAIGSFVKLLLSFYYFNLWNQNEWFDRLLL